MKTLKERVEVMQAYLDGKTIQDNIDGNWTDWESGNDPQFNWSSYDYRIKPENKQVPYDFSDAESLIGRKVKRGDQCISIISSVYNSEVAVFSTLHSFVYISEYFEIWNNTLNRWEPCTKTVKA